MQNMGTEYDIHTIKGYFNPGRDSDEVEKGIPRDKDGNIDFRKVGQGICEATLNPFGINLEHDEPEQSGQHDLEDKARAAKKDSANLDDEQVTALLFEKIKEQYGDEAKELLAEGIKKAAIYQQSLANAEDGTYRVVDGKLIVDLKEVGTIKATSAYASGLELAFEIVGEVASMPATKGLLQVGKFVVRVNPYVSAALIAYEIGSIIYDQALAEKRSDLVDKSEQTQAFAKQTVDKAKETSRNKMKADVGGGGSPNFGPNDFEPDDNNENHRSKTRTKIAELAKKLKEEYNWDVSDEVKDKMSEEFKGKGEVKINRDGKGIKWETKHGQNDIRVDKGDPKADFPSQQVDHVRVNREGKVIGRNGEVVKETPQFPKPKNNPDSHIPLKEWVKWKK